MGTPDFRHGTGCKAERASLPAAAEAPRTSPLEASAPRSWGRCRRTPRGTGRSGAGRGGLRAGGAVPRPRPAALSPHTPALRRRREPRRAEPRQQPVPLPRHRHELLVVSIRGGARGGADPVASAAFPSPPLPSPSSPRAVPPGGGRRPEGEGRPLPYRSASRRSGALPALFVSRPAALTALARSGLGSAAAGAGRGVRGKAPGVRGGAAGGRSGTGRRCCGASGRRLRREKAPRGVSGNRGARGTVRFVISLRRQQRNELWSLPLGTKTRYCRQLT